MRRMRCAMASTSTRMMKTALLVASLAVALSLLAVVVDAQPAAKISVLAFEMSKCPYCSSWKQNFEDQVTSQDGLRDILDIDEWFAGTVVNASAPGGFTCHHGPGECVGNRILLCARNLTIATSKWGWWDLGVCMQTNYTNIPDDVPACIKKVGLDWTPINNCASGPMGAALLNQSIAVAAAHKVTETPTIFVDGTEYVGGPNNPLRLICSLYKGTKPAGCSN